MRRYAYVNLVIHEATSSFWNTKWVWICEDALQLWIFISCQLSCSNWIKPFQFAEKCCTWNDGCDLGCLWMGSSFFFGTFIWNLFRRPACFRWASPVRTWQLPMASQEIDKMLWLQTLIWRRATWQDMARYLSLNLAAGRSHKMLP